ncbi:MAG: DNA repair protein RecO [Bacillota bacterium]
MELDTQALCVRSMDYKDNDKLITLLTADLGKVSAQMRSAKSPKSKLKIASSPFSFGEYNLTEKNGRYTVIGAQITDNFFNIWQDIAKYAAAEIVIECADKVTIEKQECSRELVLAIKALSAICYGEIYPYVVAVWFVSKLMIEIGYDTTVDNEYSNEIVAVLGVLQGLEVDELECLDMTQASVVSVLKYLNRFGHGIFGVKINSITEAIKHIVTE